MHAQLGQKRPALKEARAPAPIGNPIGTRAGPMPRGRPQGKSFGRRRRGP
jgi:hypothetical protein